MAQTAATSMNARVIRPTLDYTEWLGLVQKLAGMTDAMQAAGFNVCAKHLQHATSALIDRR